VNRAFTAMSNQCEQEQPEQKRPEGDLAGADAEMICPGCDQAGGQCGVLCDSLAKLTQCCRVIMCSQCVSMCLNWKHCPRCGEEGFSFVTNLQTPRGHVCTPSRVTALQEDPGDGGALNDTNLEQEDACSICLQAMEDPVCVDCSGKHVFCRSCIITWRSKVSSCPLCRDVVTSVQGLSNAVPTKCCPEGPHRMPNRLIRNPWNLFQHMCKGDSLGSSLTRMHRRNIYNASKHAISCPLGIVALFPLKRLLVLHDTTVE